MPVDVMRLRASNSSFLMGSGAIYFAHPKSLFDGILRRYGKPLGDPEAFGAIGMALTNVKLPEISEDELYAILTHGHELDHARCFFGSPLGLLLFRCYFAICVTLGWLFEGFFRPGKLGAEGLERGTFLEWLEDDGLKWIRARLSSGKLALPPKPPDFPSARTWRKGIVEYVAQVALPEIVVLTRFVDGILKRDDDMTFGKFVDLANRAFDHLRMRCEIPNSPRWATGCPDSPLFPQQDSILSTEEILEYVAMQQERLVMKEMGASDQAIDEWRSSRQCGDPYLAGFDLQDRSRQPPELLLLLADAALRTPIDLVVGTKPTMLVEAHHPAWRFRYNYFTVADQRPCPRTGKTLQQRRAELFAQGNETRFDRLLCNLGVVPQPLLSDISFSADGNSDIFGSGMVNDRNTHRFPDPRLDPNRAYADVRDIFRTRLRAVLDGKINSEPPLLPLHYYDDWCSFNILKSGDDFFRLLRAHSLTTSNYLMLSLLYGGAAKPDLPPFGDVFFRRLEFFSSDTQALRRTYMERPMAETIFGSPLTNALNWWD